MMQLIFVFCRVYRYAGNWVWDFGGHHAMSGGLCPNLVELDGSGTWMGLGGGVGGVAGS